MHRTAHISALTLFVVVAVFMFGPGCSHDSSTGPVGGAVLQSVQTDILTVEPVQEMFVETFDKHSNVGGWSFFGNPDNTIEKWEGQGGNPGAYIHATCNRLACLDTYAPRLRTQVGVPSIFTGDYRARKVTKVGVDIAVFGPPLVTTGGRPLSLLLRNDNGTPDDYSDDIQVFWTGTKIIPEDNGVFKEFDIFVPSQSTILPKDWGVLGGYGTGDNDADWNKVIGDVSQITFFFGDPEMFFMFQQWELGFDNTRIWYEN